MRVLLIDPKAAERGYNLGLAYLCSSLKQRGHDVKVLDLNNVHRNKHITMVRGVLEKYRPDLVGISGVSWAFKSAVHVARYIRGFWNGPIVQGGIHASLLRGKLLEAHNEFDMVIAGEGEETLPDLADAIENSGDLHHIKGLIFREDGRIVETPARPEIKDLDSLPFPDFHPFGIKRIYSYPLLTSRGCPYTCVFCLSPVLSERRWRARSPENVLEELRHAKRVYHIKAFNIRDDNLTLRMDRAKRFCDLLAAEGMGLKWSCNNGIFARWVDSELAEKMRAAGCVEVSLGIETLVPEMFDQVRKGEHLKDIVNAVRALKGADIRVRGFFILGLPGDTYENALLTYRLSQSLGLDDYGWNTLLPFPGTGSYEWVKQHATGLPSDEWDMRHGMLTFETAEFTKEERLAAYRTIAVRTGNYAAFYDYDRPFYRNLIPMARILLGTDSRHLPCHLSKMARKYLRSCRYVPCEGAYHLRSPGLFRRSAHKRIAETTPVLGSGERTSIDARL